MINNRIRTIVRTTAGASLTAAALGLGLFGTVGTANAAPAPMLETGYSVYTCYDYATQTFYDCV